MERLISFLMDNFFYVIVVLGAIYSMFFRKSPLERPPNRMPDFGGGGFPRPQRPVERKPPGWPGPNTVQREQPRPMEATLPERKSEASEHSLSMEGDFSGEPTVSLAEEIRVSAVPVRSRPAGAAEPDKPSPSPADHDSDRALSREDLTRAIVWAEILGPPRARRPYRR